jgi:hypothetical protein
MGYTGVGKLKADDIALLVGRIAMAVFFLPSGISFPLCKWRWTDQPRCIEATQTARRQERRLNHGT